VRRCGLLQVWSITSSNSVRHAWRRRLFWWVAGGVNKSISFTYHEIHHQHWGQVARPKKHRRRRRLKWALSEKRSGLKSAVGISVSSPWQLSGYVSILLVDWVEFGGEGEIWSVEIFALFHSGCANSLRFAWHPAAPRFKPHSVHTQVHTILLNNQLQFPPHCQPSSHFHMIMRHTKAWQNNATRPEWSVWQIKSICFLRIHWAWDESD
jgi:hypothetical protein